MILTFEFTVDNVKINRLAEYLCQWSFTSKVIVQTRRHTDKHTPEWPTALPGQLQRSVKCAIINCDNVCIDGTVLTTLLCADRRRLCLVLSRHNRVTLISISRRRAACQRSPLHCSGLPGNRRCYRLLLIVCTSVGSVQATYRITKKSESPKPTRRLSTPRVTYKLVTSPTLMV